MADFNLPNTFTTGDGQNYSFANQFTVASATDWTAILWWRDGTSPFPTKVYGSRLDTGALLVNIGPAPVTWVDQGNGWWLYTLPASVPLVSGITYNLCTYLESNGSRQAHTSQAITPDAPLNYIGSRWGSGDQVYPPTGAGNEKYGLSPVTGAGVPAGPGVLEQGDLDAISAELADWLQYGNPNLRTDSLPKLIHDLLGSVNTQIGLIKAKTDLLPFPLNKLTDAYLTALESNVASIMAQLTTMDAGITAINSWIAGDPTAGLATEAAVQALYQGQNFDRDRLTFSIGDPAWTLQDEFAWVEGCAWPVPADVYVFHIVNYPESKTPVTLHGVPLLWRAGWWCPLDGTMAAPRQSLDFPLMKLHQLPSRMQGLMAHCGPGYAGTVQAYIWSGLAP